MAPLDILDLWSIRDRFSDVTIRCKNNQTLRAHKIVLSAASKQLLDLCTNNDVIDSTGISLEVIEHLLEFIYTGQTPTDDNHLKQEVSDLAKLWGVKSGRNSQATQELAEDQISDGEEESNPDLKELEDTRTMVQGEFPDQSARLTEGGPGEENPASEEKIPDQEEQLPEQEIANCVATNLTAIPDELIVKIFSYLSTWNLLFSAPKVSQQFSRLSQDSGAHVSVDLTRCYLTFAEVKTFLEGKRQIESIQMNLDQVTADPDEMRWILDSAILDQKKIRSVILSMNDQGSLLFNKLADNPSKAEQIRHLEITCSWGSPVTRIPKLKNLVRLGLHFTETTSAFDQFKFISALASQSQKLESLEVGHDDALAEDQIVNLIDQHGKTLKGLKCRKWMMSAHFASTNLAPGSCFRNVEILTFDASQLPLSTLVQITKLPKLKGLTINVRFDLNQELLIQIASAIDFKNMAAFTINATWNPEYRAFTRGRGPSGSCFSLSHGARSFEFDKGDAEPFDLTEALSLPGLDQLERIDLRGGFVNNLGSLIRFEKLIFVQIVRDRISLGDILQLVMLAKERPSIGRISAQSSESKIDLFDRTCFSLTTAAGINVEAQVKAIFDALASFQLKQIHVKSASPVLDSVLELAAKMTKLEYLSVELGELSVSLTNVLAMLNLAVAKRLTCLKLTSVNISWSLIGLNRFTVDLGQGSLEPNDLKQMLACLKGLTLTKLELSFGGKYHDEFTELIGQIKSLEYLAMRNAKLDRIPKLLNPELVTLKVGGVWTPGKDGIPGLGAFKDAITLLSYTRVHDKAKDRNNFLAKEDLCRIAAMPKLEYFQMYSSTPCCKVSSQRFFPPVEEQPQ